MQKPLEKYLIIPLWLGGVDEHQLSCTRDLLLAPACNRTAVFSSWSNEALRMVWRNTGGGTPPLMSQIGIGGLLEVAGGVAIILGLLTRAVAFVLSGEMAVAYWQFHAPNATWPIQNQGQPAVLFCFIFLYMAARGAGEWSLDELLHRKRG